jgi:hypothetical protein
MKALEGLYSRQSTPVDGLGVPDSDGTHNSTEPVSKQTNRDGAQYDGGRTKGNVIEEILCRKDCRGCSGI